ncbi:MAG: 4Fe-4S ferredoxin [Microcoleus vaginatus WJT46-NPBG5]|nr:4Fe-4S ferredoxin [Microcoleus vaginatus WJT46-NPBG5]
MSNLYYPLNSLKQGHWFKLICGASFQHLPAVRNLTLAYSLAGADCIDVAADPAVIAAAQEALQSAEALAPAARRRGFKDSKRPWLMVSLNDGEDPHFRKAEFNPAACPADCPRPCESICPAQAIVFQDADARGKSGSGKHQKTSHIQNLNVEPGFSGVIDQQCYGCGRCLPVCPIQQIVTRSYVATPAAVAPMVLATDVDAVEIHTQVGRVADFRRLWNAIAPWVGKLKLVAISCGDGEGLIDYLHTLYELISPLPCPLIWQTDGRPMSGDIGDGTTRAAVKLGEKVLAAGLPGYVQLAGGTNSHTVAKLKAAGLLKREGTATGEEPCRLPSHIAGIAYGSYARVLLSPVLEQLEPITQAFAVAASSQGTQLARLEDTPELLWAAVSLADSLVNQLKTHKIAPTLAQQIPMI